MNATTVATDLTRDVSEVATANRTGRIIGRKRLTRRQLEVFVDGLPAGTAVVMEACGTARINALRGMLREHGMPMAPGAGTVLTKLPLIVEDAVNSPAWCGRSGASDLSRRDDPPGSR